jgi:hypothetical protein
MIWPYPAPELTLYKMSELGGENWDLGVFSSVRHETRSRRDFPRYRTEILSRYRSRYRLGQFLEKTEIFRDRDFPEISISVSSRSTFNIVEISRDSRFVKTCIFGLKFFASGYFWQNFSLTGAFLAEIFPDGSIFG